MKFPLIFTHPSNLNLKLKFGTFFIIDGLANSLNLGKPILDEISTVWDFTSDQIRIKDINIQLVENIEEENGGHIRSISHSPKPEKNIKQQFSLKSLKWGAAARNDVQLGFIYHSLKVEGSSPSLASRGKVFTSRNCHKLTRLPNSFWSNYFLLSVSSQVKTSF